MSYDPKQNQNQNQTKNQQQQGTGKGQGQGQSGTTGGLRGQHDQSEQGNARTPRK